VIKITFIDSYNLLQRSIKKLCIDFDCEVIKGTFAYDFFNSNTLYYIGNTPSLDYYPKNDISKEDYNLINRNN
jgi:hypothetical protein